MSQEHPAPPSLSHLNKGRLIQKAPGSRCRSGADTRTGLALGSPGTEVEQSWSCDAASEQHYLWIQIHLMSILNCIFKVRHYNSCEQVQSARAYAPESSALLTSLNAAATCAQVCWLLWLAEMRLIPPSGSHLPHRSTKSC